MQNPFATTGYAGAEYFCDRVKETAAVTSLLTNGNNIALISPRRYGKTDLIRHCFNQEVIKDNYYTFIIDIYSTKSLAEMTGRMGKAILEELKPFGKKAWTTFINTIASMKAGVSYDAAGVPSWTLSVGEIKNPVASLDEIFSYIHNADRHCLIAIDEFQQITKYGDGDVEATLRTHIQYCTNANFIFSGSEREMMGTMFTSSARPFYQSATVINLPPIAEPSYADFCGRLFENRGRHLDPQVVPTLYGRFYGTTFYLQKVMNILFMRTAQGETCHAEDIDAAVDYIIDFSAATYEDMLYQLPSKQTQVLIAIAKEGVAKNITAGAFVRKHALTSASSVKSAVNGLIEKGLLTSSRGEYHVYDLFLKEWLVSRYL